jgi:hypothetical protein
VIAWLERGHAMPNFRHDTGTFVAQDGGEDTLGICARECVVVGVAYPLL